MNPSLIAALSAFIIAAGHSAALVINALNKRGPSE